MRKFNPYQTGVIGTVAAAALALGIAGAPTAPAVAAPSAARPSGIASETLTLSVGRGQLVKLKGAMSDLFVAKPEIADVQVKSNTQLYVFGKAAGETTVYATDKSGAVIWSSTIRVGQNLNSVGAMLDLAMPDADIKATAMNGLVLLTGTVGAPADVEEAQRLTQAFVGAETQVVSRLRSSVPLQVNLQVRIAEVSRNVLKNVGVNLLTRDTTGGFMFGIAQGRAGGASFTTPNFTGTGIGSTIGGMGSIFGLDIVGSLDLAEQDGLVTTLASPNLTALSGETASFLAGGEIPIPISQGLGSVSVDYKQYGVSLAFTPTVLSNGRISMRVRPEVSQLDDSSAVTVNGFSVPGLTTRRVETTVELGSGQSFVIGGLLSNTHNNSINKAPFLADLPILGALFRSNAFRRQQTELVVVVTPYLVKPVASGDITLPTDGYKAPTDAGRILGGELFGHDSGGTRPKPTMVTPSTTVPPAAPAPARSPAAAAAPVASSPAQRPSGTASAAPGFSFN